MDNNNNNQSLLGFLQKKSLFNNSPNNRSRNRSRSGSRDRQFNGSRSNVYQLDDRSDLPSEKGGQRFNYQEDSARNYDRSQYRGGPPPNLDAQYRSNNDRSRFDQPPPDPKYYQSSLPPQHDFRPQTDPKHYQSNIPQNDMRGFQSQPYATSPTSEYRGGGFQQ